MEFQKILLKKCVEMKTYTLRKELSSKVSILISNHYNSYCHKPLRLPYQNDVWATYVSMGFGEVE